jgi:hypothetical protein
LSRLCWRYINTIEEHLGLSLIALSSSSAQIAVNH